MIYYLMFSMEEQREIIHHTKMRDCKVLEQVEAKSFLDGKAETGLHAIDHAKSILG